MIVPAVATIVTNASAFIVATYFASVTGTKFYLWYATGTASSSGSGCYLRIFQFAGSVYEQNINSGPSGSTQGQIDGTSAIFISGTIAPSLTQIFEITIKDNDSVNSCTFNAGGIVLFSNF